MCSQAESQSNVVCKHFGYTDLRMSAAVDFSCSEAKDKSYRSLSHLLWKSSFNARYGRSWRFQWPWLMLGGDENTRRRPILQFQPNKSTTAMVSFNFVSTIDYFQRRTFDVGLQRFPSISKRPIDVSTLPLAAGDVDQVASHSGANLFLSTTS